MLSSEIYSFYESIRPPTGLPAGVETLYPQSEPAVLKLVKIFLDKYYSDNRTRILLMGINPGRFGAGATGINFTAPRQLTGYCGIPNTLKQQSELSAEFIYEMIENYGGCEKFYSHFFISAVSPLGYIKDGKNMNYYDDKKLKEALTPFITRCIDQQYSWNIDRETCICIGGEKNFNFLFALNEKKGWFKNIYPLPHPRFILQYRRKKKDEYIRQYVTLLETVRSNKKESTAIPPLE